VSARVTGFVDPRNVGLCTYRSPAFPDGCLAPGSWHGVERDLRYGIVTCDRHQLFMGSLVYWVHELASPCGLPAARFVAADNRCEVDWAAAEREFERLTRRTT